MAEWLRSGLQSRVHQFDSGRRLSPLPLPVALVSAGDPHRSAHGGPSVWVLRWSELIPPGGLVLDVACGRGRHTRALQDRGLRVVAVDRDVSGLSDLAGHPDLEAIEGDLEAGDPPPGLAGPFAAIVVMNYLHRPLLGALVAAVAPGGVLIYETFAAGHERFGRPRSPEHLLQPGELLETVRGRLRVVAYEDVVVGSPPSAAVQHICALRNA